MAELGEGVKDGFGASIGDRRNGYPRGGDDHDSDGTAPIGGRRLRRGLGYFGCFGWSGPLDHLIVTVAVHPVALVFEQIPTGVEHQPR